MDFDDNKIKDSKDQSFEKKPSFWKEFGIVSLAIFLSVLTVIVINI